MKVAVGISGGVDSTVAALLLKERGYDVLGVVMTLGRAGEDEMLEEARAVADKLVIDLKVVDLSSQWREIVIGGASKAYLAATTPNPCVTCNEFVKLGLLPRFAFDTLGMDMFATGHYAQVENGRIFRGVDGKKDQSYFLYCVSSDILKRLILPLGGMTKKDVRAIAMEAGFGVAKKDDSEDFCGGGVDDIVERDDMPGEIVDDCGKRLGTHRGYWHYTLGMRKGFGIGGGTPFYVSKIDPQTNRITLSPREKVVCTEFDVESLTHPIEGRKELSVKVRSQNEPQGPVFLEGTHCECPKGLFAVTPGQSAVFYDGEELVTGGIIIGKGENHG